MGNELTVRSADAADVKAIAGLLAYYAARQIVLPRDEADIRHYLGNFLVALIGDKVVGCVAVRDFGASLFEVRSLAVDSEYQDRRVGRSLVERAMENLRRKHPEGFRLFTLTYVPGFFEKLGFAKVGRELFPEKIWCDCNNCPKQDHCDEIALLYNWERD